MNRYGSRELCAAAYQVVIEALSSVTYVFVVHYRSALRGIEHTEETELGLSSMDLNDWRVLRSNRGNCNSNF